MAGNRKLDDDVRRHLQHMDRALISDIDNTLIGDPAALDRLLRRLAGSEVHVCFGIATGRHLEITLEVLEEWGVPLPDVLVTAVGTEIYYGPHLQPDSGWSEQIARQWEPDKIREVLAEMSDLRLQAPKNQRSFKISYVISPDKSGCVRQVEKLLPKRGLFAKAVFSHGRFLDILPADAGKGAAIRYLAGRWHWPPEHILVAGDSGNDADMLQGGYRGVAVGNHSPELEWLRGKPRVFFAPGKYAAGICDGLDYYGFLNAEYRKPGGR